MLVQKYPYQKLTRANINGSRMYSCPNNQKLPSVTSVLSYTKPSKNVQALQDWRKRVGYEKAAAITLEASGRGTRMHSFLEEYMKTGITSEPGTNPFSIQSHKMADHIIKNSLNKVTKFYGCEVSLYYPELYAGATDSVSLFNNKLSIIDFKQTNKPKKQEWITDYFLQLAAYIEAHNILYNTNIEQGIIMMCSVDLEYQQWILTGTELETYKNKWWERLHQYYRGIL